LSKKLLAAVKPSSEKVDLDRDILKPLISHGKIYAYPTPEYIKDMGTPDRYDQVCADIENGMVRRRNLSVKQKAVFLDRDGTINRLNGFITKPEELELIDGAAEAIRKINSAGYLAIVITNQPVIARGEASLEDLDLIHRKMETELGKAGAYVDDIFFCPHHPDKGFAGERPEYKIDCDCRKPKPGMILKAAEKYNIDLAQSYMVGDDIKDVQAGLAAGCKAALLGAAVPGYTGMVFRNLKEFTEFLFENKRAR
jgi:D-glycero-D-manno-heptose 1,7-bisphosphate phosphatase